MSVNYKNKTALVVGLGRSGVGAANLLDALGAHVFITDQKPANYLIEFVKQLSPSVKVLAGAYPNELLNHVDLIVVSPGVPLDIPFIQKAVALNVPVLSELELAYSVSKSPFIAITGTNGKTTTTTLVDHILKSGGFTTELCGNIGQAVTDKLLKNRVNGDVQYMVTEVSSFQLETMFHFRPKVAAILNITPDHLDRHKSMEEYIRAKARIYENQTKEDALVLNWDDPLVATLGGTVSVEKWFFSSRQQVKGVYLDEGWICFHDGNNAAKLFPASEISLKGRHNLENVMAAAIVGILAGCTLEAMRKAVAEFKAIGHRMEIAGTVNNVTFINDSKATNPGAVLRAIEELSNVILLMGGRDKDNDFTILKSMIRQNVKRLIIFGEAREKINSVLGNEAETTIATGLNDAVATAYKSALPGDIVLLSPGCASFDEFKDYADRGNRFKEIVERLELTSL